LNRFKGSLNLFNLHAKRKSDENERSLDLIFVSPCKAYIREYVREKELEIL